MTLAVAAEQYIHYYPWAGDPSPICPSLKFFSGHATGRGEGTTAVPIEAVGENFLKFQYIFLRKLTNGLSLVKKFLQKFSKKNLYGGGDPYHLLDNLIRGVGGQLS